MIFSECIHNKVSLFLNEWLGGYARNLQNMSKNMPK